MNSFRLHLAILSYRTGERDERARTRRGKGAGVVGGRDKVRSGPE